MMKKDTINPTIYSNPITPPLYSRSHPRTYAHAIMKKITVITTNITSAIRLTPENRLLSQSHFASAVPAVRLRNNYFSKEYNRLAGCKLQEPSIESLQVARTRST